jgi:CTP synthase
MDPETPYPVIDLLPEQKDVEDLGGTKRLGAQAVELVDGTHTREVYGGEPVISERHRHRYEVNNAYRQRLEDAGLVFSGTLPGRGLIEYVELPREVHPYYVATQAHPEFRSRPNRAHPLFAGLVKAAVDAQRAARLVEVERPVDQRPDALSVANA